MEDTPSDLVEDGFQVLSNGEVYKSAVTYLLNVFKGLQMTMKKSVKNDCKVV
jgi:hypothetical protein